MSVLSKKNFTTLTNGLSRIRTCGSQNIKVKYILCPSKSQNSSICSSEEHFFYQLWNIGKEYVCFSLDINLILPSILNCYLESECETDKRIDEIMQCFQSNSHLHKENKKTCIDCCIEKLIAEAELNGMLPRIQSINYAPGCVQNYSLHVAQPLYGFITLTPGACMAVVITLYMSSNQFPIILEVGIDEEQNPPRFRI